MDKKFRNYMILGGIASVLLALMLFWPYGGETTFQVGDSTYTAQGDLKQGRMEIQDEYGSYEITYKHSGIIENFPQDVPLYSPAKVNYSSSQNGHKTVILITDEPVRKVADAYERMLPEFGWTMQATPERDASDALREAHYFGMSAFKGENFERIAEIDVFRNENGSTRIELFVYDQKIKSSGR